MSLIPPWVDQHLPPRPPPGDVLAWLESPEGDQWRLGTLSPMFTIFGEFKPARKFSTYTSRLSEGPVRPEHDPCGRPPMGP